ncbi:MAG: hypothetical protein SO116_09825, partial [Treponema sp.]|nr:hypothetical protein [Treponema sp.]
ACSCQRVQALREGLADKRNFNSYSRQQKEQCTLACSVLEEDAALAQVRCGGAACSCRECRLCEKGFARK